MNICVYGASSCTIDKSFITAGEELGRKMAAKGIGLVFGGGAEGMMGAAARGVHEGKGYILGVAPSFFKVDGVLYDKCTDFVYTETMRQRKQKMEDSSDAFIITAGGIGTFEEFFEILTLKQLGRHNKPIAILNTNGYYDAMIKMMEVAVEGDFLTAKSLELYKVFDDIDEMLDYIENYNEEIHHITELKNINDGE